MPLLYHPNGPCPANGVIPICRYLEHNDGMLNPASSWTAFMDACMNGPRVGVVCPGAWVTQGGMTIPNGYPLKLRGEGAGISQLFAVADPSKTHDQNGQGLYVHNAALCVLEDLGVHSQGKFTHTVLIAPDTGSHCDRNVLSRVDMSGNQLSQATLGLTASGQTDLYSSTAFNYGPDFSRAVDIIETAGITFINCQLHQYAGRDGDGGLGPPTLNLHHVDRIEIRGGILGSEPPTPKPVASAYIQCDTVKGVELYNVLCQSDNGRQPRHMFQMTGPNVTNMRVIGQPGIARVQLQPGNLVWGTPGNMPVPGGYVQPDLVG